MKHKENIAVLLAEMPEGRPSRWIRPFMGIPTLLSLQKVIRETGRKDTTRCFRL
jgi:hypothetical protein